MKYLIVVCMGLFLAGMLATAARAEDAPAQVEYAVGIDDILDINVMQPEKSLSTVTVAPDGSITFAYIGNVRVKGMSLAKIQEEIQSRLANGYMKYPVVAVSLRQMRSKKFFVYGEVVRPGTYPLEEDMAILKAISMAGGFTKFGSSSRVKVLRERKDKPGYDALKVSIKNIMDGSDKEDVVLHNGDIVVVSEGVF